MQYYIEFVIYRDASLPLNPIDYKLELLFDGQLFSIWSFIVAGAFLDEMTSYMEGFKEMDKIVGYRIRKAGPAGEEGEG